MTITSALCFGLTGGALVLQPFISHSWASRLRLICAVVIILIGGIAIGETILRTSSTHLNSLQKSTGQMNPAAGVGFVLTGFLLIASDRSKQAASGTVIQVFTALVAAIGVIGALSFLINIDYLYVLPHAERMAFPTACNFIIVALGVWCVWSGAQWNVETAEEIASHHIYRTLEVLLVIIVAAVSFVVFGFSQASSEQLMLDQMSIVAKGRRDFFESVLQLHLDQAIQISSRPAIISFVRDLVQNESGPDTTRLSPLVVSAQSFLMHGFSAFAYIGPDSEILTSHGEFVSQPEIRIPIAGKYPSELLWKDGYILRTRLPLTDSAGLSGYVLAEQPMNELTRMHREALRHGETGDLVVCGLAGDRQVCFPIRWNDHAGTYPAYVDGKALPLTRAARGETATDLTTDFRRQRVMAALGPIGSTGLGMATKMDMWELYAPIRKQFLTALPFLALLIAGSLWLIRIRLHPLVEAVEKSRHEFKFIALHDALTGIPNRLLFNDRLGQTMIRSKRSKKLMAVMYMDLDHFKKINDTFGHQVGDDVLRRFARHLKKTVRASDTVARLGGDEFTIILENLSSVDQAERIARAIQHWVADPDKSFSNSQIKNISTSIGIAFYQGKQEEPEQLLQRADAALYQCKQKGGGRYQIALETGTSADFP